MNNEKNKTKKPVYCQLIKTFVEGLVQKGFRIVNDGDYRQEGYPMPDEESLFFKLESPIDLSQIDLTVDTFTLAPLGNNTFMCECHYNIVKLVSPIDLKE